MALRWVETVGVRVSRNRTRTVTTGIVPGSRKDAGHVKYSYRSARLIFQIWPYGSDVLAFRHVLIHKKGYYRPYNFSFMNFSVQEMAHCVSDASSSI